MLFWHGSIAVRRNSWDITATGYEGTYDLMPGHYASLSYDGMYPFAILADWCGHAKTVTPGEINVSYSSDGSFAFGGFSGYGYDQFYLAVPEEVSKEEPAALEVEARNLVSLRL